jgi:ribokinase
MPLYPDPAPPVDRTGAGDSFASTFVAAIIKGQSIDEALRWAPINSMNVVQKVGAQAGLLSTKALTHYLNAAPKWYHPKRI